MEGAALGREEASRRLSEVRGRMAEAERRASRAPGSASLLAVSKTFGADAVEAFVEAGQNLFGESYILEARDKIPAVKGSPVWHFIGRLQTNKAKYAARLFDAVHALDSMELASELDKRLSALGRKMECYIQVNISHEDAKNGIEADGLPGFLDALSACNFLIPVGLMGMPPFDLDPEASRPYFRSLYELREKRAPMLKGLSMGMSGDYEVAVEEGSTIVRVGTTLFGPRGRP
jgi:pyridoxal phosphate enzyme (YggS family)